MQTQTDLTFSVNGTSMQLQGTSPTQTLLSYLRHHRFVGTKEGCGDGDCGACTVVMIGPGVDGQPHYQAVNSCLIPVGALGGRDLYTVEGIVDQVHHLHHPHHPHADEARGATDAHDILHPVQQAMIEFGGSQCGYCTPGFIMSLFAGYYEGQLDNRTVEGNLCRCTGYLPIRRAAQHVAQQMAAIRTRPDRPGSDRPIDRFAQHLEHATVSLEPTAYVGNHQRFYRPTRLTDVLALLQTYPHATLVAGCTDLGLDMSWHRQPYPVMISLEGVEALQQLIQTDTTVVIGAAIPLSHLGDQLQGIFPCLDEMLHWFAARQVRNRATLGGNLGTASPIGDMAPVLLALDAMVQVVSAAGIRTISIEHFFIGYRATALQPGEVIQSVTLPKAIAPGAVQRLSQSYKVGKRGTDDISIVAASYTIDLNTDHHIVHARLAYGGVAATPVRAIAIETWLIGQPWTHSTVLAAKERLKTTFTPLSDVRGSADYRQHLVANLFEKFFVEFDHDGATISTEEVAESI